MAITSSIHNSNRSTNNDFHDCDLPPGGHSQYILVGVCRGTSKKGGLRHWHNLKMGGPRHGHESKKGGGLKNWSCKKDNLSN